MTSFTSVTTEKGIVQTIKTRQPMLLLEAGSAKHTAHTERSAPNESEKLFARLRIFPEHTQHRAGHSLAVHFLHPSHYHAHVSTKQATKGEETVTDLALKIKKQSKKNNKLD